MDRSGQSPECPPLSARPLSPPQPPPPRSQEASVGPRSETGQFVDLEHCLGLEQANLSKPKTDLRIFHMAIVASTRLKHSKFLPWQEKSLSYPRALKSPLSLANCHEYWGNWGHICVSFVEKITFYNSAILHESFRNSIINSVSLIF